MQNGTLNDALETERGLRVNLVLACKAGGVALDEIGQFLAQVIQIGCARAQHLGCGRIVQHGEQQVFHRDELVPLLPGLHKGHMQRYF